ncbi:MAG: hypothetical protein N3E40_04755 [Dehalococcoidia bacterium]|nr:hypothetical protein [Dehalococcoidia bacterium]
MSEALASIFSDQAIREFGSALRTARRAEDYASLIELENVETVSQLAEALMKFLRRFDSLQRRNDRSWRPASSSYERIMELASRGKESVRLVRAALISHALTYEAQAQLKEEKDVEQPSL